jgi:hypothetical protein
MSRRSAVFGNRKGLTKPELGRRTGGNIDEVNVNERFLWKTNGLVSNISMCIMMEDSNEIESLWGEITGDNDETRRPSEVDRVCGGGVLAAFSGPLLFC